MSSRDHGGWRLTGSTPLPTTARTTLHRCLPYILLHSLWFNAWNRCLNQKPNTTQSVSTGITFVVLRRLFWKHSFGKIVYEKWFAVKLMFCLTWKQRNTEYVNMLSDGLIWSRSRWQTLCCDDCKYVCGCVILQGLDCLCNLIGLQSVLGHFRTFGLDFSYILPVVLCFEFLSEFERHSVQSVTDAVVN